MRYIYIQQGPTNTVVITITAIQYILILPAWMPSMVMDIT